MVRFISLASLLMVLAVVGCSKPASTNITDNADQKALDAYNEQVAKDEAEMSGYTDPK